MFDDYGISTCPMCRRNVRDNRFTFVETYQIWVCKRCYRANTDGWSIRCERVLVEHMRRIKMPLPRRNQSGWLPREVYRTVEILDE